MVDISGNVAVSVWLIYQWIVQCQCEMDCCNVIVVNISVNFSVSVWLSGWCIIEWFSVCVVDISVNDSVSVWLMYQWMLQCLCCLYFRGCKDSGGRWCWGTVSLVIHLPNWCGQVSDTGGEHSWKDSPRIPDHIQQNPQNRRSEHSMYIIYT